MNFYPDTSNKEFNLHNQTDYIEVYRFMNCNDIETFKPLHQVNKDQFNILMNNKVNDSLTLLTRAHVEDMKRIGEFDTFVSVYSEHMDKNLKNINQSPFISVTLNPLLAITSGTLDSIISNTTCLVTLNVPLKYLCQSIIPISYNEGELLLLLPPGITFNSFVKNHQSNPFRSKNLVDERIRIKKELGIVGGLVTYSDTIKFRWNFNFGGKSYKNDDLHKKYIKYKSKYIKLKSKINNDNKLIN